MRIPIVLTVVILLAIGGAEAVIGVNWGRQSAQRLVPSQVVDLLLQNGIGNARVYTSEEDILQAFAGSGINLTVTIFNPSAITSMGDARSWVQKRYPYFSLSSIRTVYLGGYVFLNGLENKSYIKSAMNSLQNLQAAINEAGYGGQVKATFLHISTLLKNVTKPSEAEFQDEIKEDMKTFVRFLRTTDAPFVIETFPIVEAESFDLSFAFFDNQSAHVVKDINGAVYTNTVEYVYDSFVWALTKINASDLKVIVGQVGWPTDGYAGANVANAERFYKGLLPWAASNKGTPMRPGAPIDIYVHALTDENKMSYYYPFTRHWGIYRSNGQPKFKIDLSGQGRDIFPTTAKGIMRMPDRWCVFNGNNTDPNKVKKEFDGACSKADCTALAPGGSCSRLSYEQNISYAFNSYFQTQFQDEKACIFGEFGTISLDDPSTGECVFPMEVVKGHQVNYVKALGIHVRPNRAISVFLLSILASFV